MRKERVIALGMTGALIVVLAAATGTVPLRAGTAETTAAAAVPANVSAIHDPDSAHYDADCLSCHASILKETSKDPRVPGFHQAMLPYVPGFNARKGAENKHCVTCHRDAIDFDHESSTSLRRTVSVESCVYCHSRSGPGPVYYK